MLDRKACGCACGNCQVPAAAAAAAAATLLRDASLGHVSKVCCSSAIHAAGAAPAEMSGTAGQLHRLLLLLLLLTAADAAVVIDIMKEVTDNCTTC